MGRVIYAVRYYAGVNRSLGFGLAFIPTMIMLVGALAAAVMTVMNGGVAAP